MAELNLKQIIDKLNAEFIGENRKLVFWYDDRGEFAEDIDSVVLDNAQIYHLEPNNQFYTKLFFEQEDTTTSYLVYAPFPKPDVKDNHLEDTLLYSKRFFADRASLLSVDLGIEDKYKPVIQKHIKFFKSKERTQRFYDLEIENFNEENILVGMLASVCKSRICSFEEVIRIMVTDSSFDENKFLNEIANYDLLTPFWDLCEKHFGYADENPTLEKLFITLLMTKIDMFVGKVPKHWSQYVSDKQGNCVSFVDNLMNNVLYQDRYDVLAALIEDKIDAKAILEKIPTEYMIECDVFPCMDELIIKWLNERLLAEDTGASMFQYDIEDICLKRLEKHYSKKYYNIYQMLLYAYCIIEYANYEAPSGFKNIIKAYTEEDCYKDRNYRFFYQYFDQIKDSDAFSELRQLVENIYTNEYIAKILQKWNEGIQEPDALLAVPLQRKFYDRHVRNAKERTVVIISDAMRYEVGVDLKDRLLEDPKCNAKLEPQLSTLPSYTSLGMAALLPHHSLEITEDYKVLADGNGTSNLAARQAVLQSAEANRVCVQFDEVKKLNKDGLRSIFTGKQVVYVYHNQIDARGDEQKTEDEVFVACEEAIREIMEFVRRVSLNANTYHFLITSDHGFIYKRDKVTESDKISSFKEKTAYLNRRFIMANTPVEDDGVQSMSLGAVLGNDDPRYVSFPVGANVFKMAGGGQNYVHGGSSPQEMLVPVLEIKMDRGHAETKNAQITLVSMVQKITNPITSLDFMQTDIVSDTVKKANYRIFFSSQAGEKISNEMVHEAASRDSEATKRIFRLKFTFKNRSYDLSEPYYLIIMDDLTGQEVFRHPVLMDLIPED